MEYLVKVTSTYAVCCPEGGELTDDKGMKETLEAGKQYHFTAQSGKWYTTAPITLTKCSTFKRAALALGLLGGGVKSDLPDRYLRAEFLRKATKEGQSAYVNTGITMADDVGFFAMAAEYSSNTWLAGCGGHFNYANRQYVRIPTLTAAAKASWAWGAANLADMPEATVGAYSTSLNFKNDRKATLNGVDLQNGIPALVGDNYGEHIDVFALTMSHENHPTYGFMGRLYSLQISKGSDIVRDYVPCLNVLGTPCLFDKIGKADLKSATKEAFVAGFTISQARKLGTHLPEGGGELTVSLPTGYEQDSAVAESLETARAKGWTLTVQTYDAEAAAATFGMRRIWVRRQQDEQGGYVDADGVRWSVDWCVDMLTPDGSTPDAYGYELYRSTEAAVAYWELTPWVDPEAEQERFNITDV